MARVTASITTFACARIGTALNNGRAQFSCWKPVFEGYPLSKSNRWLQARPDAIMLVYNDDASALTSTSCRPLRSAVPLAFRTEGEDGFRTRAKWTDIRDWRPMLLSSSCNRTSISRFSTRWMVILANRGPLADVRTTQHWPVRVGPLAVDVGHWPPPCGSRSYELGKAIRAPSSRSTQT